MSRLAFDFNNAMAQMAGAHGFTPQEIEAAQGRIAAAHRELMPSRLAFVSCPPQRKH